MKIKQSVYVFIALLAVLTLSACGENTPSQKTASKNAASQAADRVLVAYQLHGMLEQAGPIVTDALKANLPADVSKVQQQQLQKAVNQAYAPDELMRNISRNMVAAAKRDNKLQELSTAADALESDLVKRMIKLDDAAASDEFADQFAAFLETPVEEGADKRMQIMQSLAKNLRLVELQTAFNVGMMRGMIEGRNAAAPKPYTMSQENAEKMLRETRDGLTEHLTRQVPVMMFFAYRDVSDEQLAQYVSLQDSDALRWVNQAVVAAMEKAFANASHRVPERYKALHDGEPT